MPARSTQKAKKFVRVPVAKYRQLVSRSAAYLRLKRGQTAASPKGAANAEGLYPAIETLRSLLAQNIAERRKAVGLSQAELATRAGVRQETISRLESGRHAPNVATVDKIEAAFKSLEKSAPSAEM